MTVNMGLVVRNQLEWGEKDTNKEDGKDKDKDKKPVTKPEKEENNTVDEEVETTVPDSGTSSETEDGVVTPEDEIVG